ncbi:MAG: DUF4412 domain-containing protein [Balneolaceae bacterium]|nr:DUF4412 domain-containing protein [Balneolaceae bacterium]
MVKKYGLFVVSMLLFIGMGTPAAAQFEGKIVFDSYDVSSDGNRNQEDQFSLYLTQDRILLEGNNQYNFMGPIQTEGVLVRLDFEDFVFLTGDQSAMKISKQDINSMMNMFGSGKSPQSQSRESDVSIDKNSEVNYERTGETQMIQGYKCEKFVFTDEDNANNHAEVWLTNEIKINWGMLAEPWGNTDIDMMGDRLSFNLIFEEGMFPLKIEAYESDVLTQVTEVSEVNKSDIARAMVQIPQGVKVLSLQDYLFNKMSRTVVLSCESWKVQS